MRHESTGSQIRLWSLPWNSTQLSDVVCWKKVIFIDQRWLPRTCYDNSCPSKSVFNNSMEGHWANSLCTLDSEIILYDRKIYIFCNQCDKEGPRKPFVICLNVTRMEETQIYRCALILAPFFYTAKDLTCCWSSRTKSSSWDWHTKTWKHESTDRENSIAARRTLENHLWHLSDEAVYLALFSDQLSVTDWVKMFDRITAKPGERKMKVLLQYWRRGPVWVLLQFSEHRHPCHA